ncbi:hypothetical protein RvY_05463 [Ramazzottius varieornatus]|uniref:OCEL domain-containing protein n=1 Tax=Ramazzottius varieornatus TaxID=947166 RepID=A0A1D1V1S7_RAMVA|nr:hypothetical protein RvY_05463 [Ramazzottius varieornatus]
MASLDPGAYRLKNGTSHTGQVSSKRLILVKLTDSALKAFEDLNQRKERTKATIQLGERDGFIQLPSGDVINFGLGDGPKSDGNFSECVQFTRRSGDLDHLGDIRQKLTVHATEDSFSNTREKMAAADKEIKKQCAKEIETSARSAGSNRGLTVTNKRPSDLSNALNKKSRLDTSPSRSPFSNKPTNVSAKLLPNHLSQGKAGSTTSATSQPAVRTSNLAVPEPNNRSSSRSPIAHPPSRPLQERLVHTLALKGGMRKSELVEKLRKYGYKDEESRQLEALLGEVATCRSDGGYELKAELFGTVDTKWPLYSTADQLTAKKRVDSLNSSSSSVMLPRSLSSASSAIPTYNPEKKSSNPIARVLNPGADLSPPPSSISACSTPSPPDVSLNKLKENNRGNLSVLNMNMTANVKKTNDDLNNNRLAPQVQSKSNEKILNQAAFPQREDTQNSLEARYATINTADQRRQYKKDFFNEYDEYKKLHKEMADISNDFSSLENDLKAVKEGSADYKRVAKSIKDKYNALKSNRDYADKRARWQELTDKLHLIKHQIKVYDAGHIKA